MLRDRASLANHVCQLVSIPNGSGDLDGTGEVVVQVAKFVAHELDLLRFCLWDVVEQNTDMCRSRHTLSAVSADHEEIVHVWLSDAVVKNSARHWISQSTTVIGDNPGVYSLVYHHETKRNVFTLVLLLVGINCILDLLNFLRHNCCLLRVTHAVTEEEDALRG
jgi:hypothetical protein